MEKKCYTVIVNVGPAKDVDDAAEKAFVMLKDGYTPDYVVPTSALESASVRDALSGKAKRRTLSDRFNLVFEMLEATVHGNSAAKEPRIKVTYNVAVDMPKLADMAARAARSKGQRSQDGALLVEVIRRDSLPFENPGGAA